MDISGVPKLFFKEGDAENIPLPNASVDILLNVESSHCYPSFPTFISEVSRVLQPEGYFIFADFRPTRDKEKLEKIFENHQLDIILEKDITPNVLEALDSDSEKRVAFIKRFTPKFMNHLMKVFAGVKGTLVYKSFKEGELTYFHYILSKKK